VGGAYSAVGLDESNLASFSGWAAGESFVDSAGGCSATGRRTSSVLRLGDFFLPTAGCCAFTAHKESNKVAAIAKAILFANPLTISAVIARKLFIRISDEDF
jgi:hypothetical protein